MIQTLQIRVYGTPRPAGSKRAFFNKASGKSIVIDANKNAKPWKETVKYAALQSAPKTPMRCPVELQVSFILARPKSHYRSGKHASELKPTAPRFHTNKPDATKLTRGTEDALTGIIWHDDSQIYRQVITKTYGDHPGAAITVMWDDEEEA